MAQAYRRILFAGFKAEGVKQDSVPLYLDLYGSALVKDNILGFSITVNRALTDFEQAGELLTALINQNITDIAVRYKGIHASGLENIRVPTSFKVASSLGGNKGFRSFLGFAFEHGIAVYPEVDFVFFRKATFSLLKQQDAAKDVSKRTGVFYEYDKSNGQVKLNSKNRYVLQPAKVEKAAQKYWKSYQKLGNNAMAPATLGNMLYSDFGGEICLAYQTVERFTGIMDFYRQQSVSLLLESANAYAIPYGQAVLQVPVTSSRFDVEDESVPFYQMVLHGVMPYSVPSVNLSGDSQYMMLKAIETGSSLLYSLSASEYSVIKNDDYDELYCLYAEDWIEEIAQNQSLVSSALAGVANQEIIRHECLQEGVYQTTYANGIAVVVNYNSEPVQIGGSAVAAKSYLAIREGS